MIGYWITAEYKKGMITASLFNNYHRGALSVSDLMSIIHWSYSGPQLTGTKNMNLCWAAPTEQFDVKSLREPDLKTQIVLSLIQHF